MNSPKNQIVRTSLMWSARWLLGGDKLHRGALTVEVSDGENSVRLTGRSDEDMGGLSLPGQCGCQAVPFSADERAILAAVTEFGARTESDVLGRAGVDRRTCLTLLDNLVARGAVQKTGAGYVPPHEPAAR